MGSDAAEKGGKAPAVKDMGMNPQGDSKMSPAPKPKA
jgi:hypothetical protein